MIRKGKKIRDISSIRKRITRDLERETHFTNSTFGGMTIGTLIDANDPQQMGRVKVFCPMFGDDLDESLDDIPWCIYCSPFGGALKKTVRGNEDTQTGGHVSYGMWAIPKVGANVMVMCLDGNPSNRAWMGCMYDQYTPHTLPHGRYMDDNLEGPLASNETQIEPLYTNGKEAFDNGKITKSTAKEWKTRGADSQNAAVDSLRTQNAGTVNNIADKTSGGEAKRGYRQSRQQPEIQVEGKTNNDSQGYSITTPGFHSFAMDDSQQNCRIRCRTTSGHQIILDDTNERIYISTAKGENWIEMDQVGNIDMFTSGNFSVHAEKDINFTANKKIKMYAKDGIHLKSEAEIKIHSGKQLHIKTDETINILTDTNMKIHVKGFYHLQADNNILVQALGDVVTNGTYIYSKSTLETYINGSRVDLNKTGTLPNVVTDRDPTLTTDFTEYAYIPSKVPEHEPWGRIATKEGAVNNESQFESNTLDGLGGAGGILPINLEYTYEDSSVGRAERGVIFPTRSTKWRR